MCMGVCAQRVMIFGVDVNLIKDVYDYREWLLQEADEKLWIMRMYHSLKDMLKG